MRTAVLLASSALSGIASAQSPELYFRVGLMDDVLSVIPGTAVLLEQAPHPDVGLSSDVEGYTPFQQVQPGFPVLVTLGETSYGAALSLGQRMFEDMPTIPIGLDSYCHTRVYNQPRAMPVLITTETSVTASPYHNRWQFEPFLEPAVKLSFQAYVGMLLTSTEIQRFAAYYGLSLTPPATGDYRLGVVIRVGGGVDLGIDSLALEIDCSGHGFSTAPSVSAFHVVAGTPLVHPYTFGGEVGLWQAAGERAHVVLHGKLERGDNLLLLHAGPQSSQRYQSSIPAMHASLPLVVTDCIPVLPSPPGQWECTPRVLSNACPSTYLGSGCGTKTIAVNTVKCGSPGTSHSSGNRSHWEARSRCRRPLEELQ